MIVIGIPPFVSPPVTSPSKSRQPRTLTTPLTVLTGRDLLSGAGQSASSLWNLARATQEQYHQITGAYLHRFELAKRLRQESVFRTLNERCASYTLRQFSGAWQSWLSGRANDSTARPPEFACRSRPLVFELGRNAVAIGPWTYHLTVLNSQQPNRYATIRLQPRPDLKMAQVKLIQLSPGLDTAHLTYYVPIPAIRPGGEEMAALDLGIYNLAAVAFSTGDSLLVSGRGLLSIGRYFHKQASRCKPSGWQRGLVRFRVSPRRRAYQRRAGHLTRLALHRLSRYLVNLCQRRGIGVLVIGWLTHIRQDKRFGRVTNQKLHAWPFAELTRQLTYKAQAIGMRVMLVDEWGTSRTCHICGQRGQRLKRGLFFCSTCNVRLNADVNAAFNLLNQVSPAPVVAGVGVVAALPGQPSPYSYRGTGEVGGQLRYSVLT